MNYRWFAILMLASLSACKMPLYPDIQSNTEIKSAQSPDQPPPDIHKMYLYINVGTWGPVSLGTAYITAKDFNDMFISEAAACNVQAVSIFDERLDILKSNHYTFGVDDRNKLFKADHSKLTEFSPDVVLTISNTSFTTTQHMARTALTDYAYSVNLEAYPQATSKTQAFWKAIVDLHPGQQTDAGSPGEVLARDIIKKLAADGILKNCPQKQSAGQ